MPVSLCICEPLSMSVCMYVLQDFVFVSQFRLSCYADDVRGLINAFDVHSALALYSCISRPQSDVDK